LLPLQLAYSHLKHTYVSLEVAQDPLCLNAVTLAYLLLNLSDLVYWKVCLLSRWLRGMLGEVYYWHLKAMHWRYHCRKGLSDLAHALHAVLVTIEDISFGHHEAKLILALIVEMLH
jgi:hypothetical protein